MNEEKGDLFIDSTITTTYDGMRRVSEQTTSSAIRVSYPELVDMEEEVEKLKIGLNGRKESSSYEEKFTITTPLQQIERVQKIVKNTWSSFIYCFNNNFNSSKH